MDCSTPGLSVHHEHPELTQTHVPRVSDAIQPSHSLSPPFSSCPQSFPAPGSFPMSLLLASGGQSTGVSASVHPVNIQDWFPLGLTGLTSLLSKGLSRVFSSTTVRRINSLALRLLYGPTLTSIHDYWKKNIALTIWTFASKGMSLLFSTLSRFVIAFLPKSKHLLISWPQSPIHSDSGAPEKKICHCFHFFPIDLPWSDGTGCHELSFLNVEFKPTVSLPLSLSSRGSLVLLHFLT